MNTGLLIARLVFGLLLAAHGTQKTFAWFGGYGLNGTGGFMEKLGFRPGRLFAAAAGYSELIGGLLVATGFLGPVGPALFVSVMIVAAVTVHWGSLFVTTNGIEVPLLYAAFAVAIALTGPGAYSLDALLGLQWLSSPLIATVALAIGAIGGFGNLALRRPAPVAVEAKQAA